MFKEMRHFFVLCVNLNMLKYNVQSVFWVGCLGGTKCVLCLGNGRFVPPISEYEDP
jgi:hypothetical protein